MVGAQGPASPLALPTAWQQGGVELAPLADEHHVLLVSWLSNPTTAHLTDLGVPAPVSPARAKELIEQQRPERGAYFFLLADRSSHAPVGYGGLGMIDAKNRSGMIGMLIGEEAQRGQGLGVDAMRLLLRFAFDELNLHRVAGEVLTFNAACLRMCEKIGMRREGVRREACFRSGQYWDVIQLSMLAREWREGSPA